MTFRDLLHRASDPEGYRSRLILTATLLWAIIIASVPAIARALFETRQ